MRFLAEAFGLEVVEDAENDGYFIVDTAAYLDSAAVDAAIALIEAALIRVIEVEGGEDASAELKTAALLEYLNNLDGMDALGVTLAAGILEGRQWMVTVTRGDAWTWRGIALTLRFVNPGEVPPDFADLWAAVELILDASPIRITIAGGENAPIELRTAALETYLNNLVGMDELDVRLFVSLDFDDWGFTDGEWVVKLTVGEYVLGFFVAEHTLFMTVHVTFVAPPPGGNWGGGPPTQQLPPEQVPLAGYDDVAQAVANTNERNEGTSVVVANVTGAIEAQPPEDAEGLTLVTIELPEGAARQATAMAILNDDLTFTAIPARFNADGSVTVIIADTVTLVALRVGSDFIDMDELLQHVQDEINTAAARMIVQGVGNNRFDPTRTVLTSEAVTMFMRAMGMPADADAPAVSGVNQEAWFAAYLNTAVANELIGGNVSPTAPMTRIQAAELLANALEVFGMRPELTESEIDALLSDFSDLQGLTQTQREALAVTVYHEIFRGHVGGTMGPNDQLTRSQMASLAVRFQNLILSR